MNLCEEVLIPSPKLQKMLNALKIILFIFILLVVINALLDLGDGFSSFIFQAIFLLFVISSKHYGYMLLFIVFCIEELCSNIQTLGIWAQVGFYKTSNELYFCFLVFSTSFQIFNIYLSFIIFRQLKYEYKIKFYPELDPDNNNERNNDEGANLAGMNNFREGGGENNENNGGGFVPFAGRGYAVGGN